MKRLNFDSLKNLDIPDTWIENALDVPVNIESKSYSFLNFSRIAATAACLAVVCATSFSVFLFMKDNGSVPVSNQTSTINTTEQKGHMEITETTGETAILETENHFTYSQASEMIQADTQEVTEKTTKVETDLPYVEPTESPTDDYCPMPPLVTEPVEYPTSVETAAPTVPATDLHTTAPSTQPLVTLPLTNPPSPTESSSQGDWAGIESYGICYGNFSSSLLTGNGMIYCRLYNSQGVLVGDSNLYSSQHMSHYITQLGDKVYVQYFLESTDLILSPGKYKFCFYNENGVDVYQDYIDIL